MIGSTLVAGALTVIAAVLLVGLLLIFRRERFAKYDMEKHRIELEMLRRSLEGQIYGLNDRLLATEPRWKDVNHLVLSAQQRQAESASLSPVPYTPLLRAMGLGERDLAIVSDRVFVLTPFHPRYETTFLAIQGAAIDLGLRAVRGDEESISGEVFPHILRQIVNARLVVAVIDGRSPNVFYELGIAVALGKVAILVSKAADKIPFDIRTNKVVIYTTAEDLKEKLQRELGRALARGNQPPHKARPNAIQPE